jgi:hypothetical protein
MALRGFPTGHFALRLDANNTSAITLLADSEGGRVYADVVSVFEAGLHFARKHLGAPRYEPFAIPVGAAASQELFDWLAGSWGPSPEKRDGAILSVAPNFNIKSEAEFTGALVVETAIPALDAASKNAGHLTVRFQPEFVGMKPGSGKLSMAAAKQKLWRTSNFVLEIDALDCTKVSRIDAFTVTRNVNVVSSGSGDITLVPDKVEFPNLTITFAASSAQTWFDWHKSFVIDGNNSNTFERNGTIRLLSIDFKTELSRIDLHHLGIIRVGAVTSDGGVTRVAAELYCEEMVLAPGVQ